MRLVIETDKLLWSPGETVAVRVLAINDSYQAVAVDRRLLIGPNPLTEGITGVPHPVSREPAFADDGDNVVILNPWGIYGRERSFGTLPDGVTRFHAYLLSEPTDALLPDRPAQERISFLSADPIAITVSQ